MIKAIDCVQTVKPNLKYKLIRLLLESYEHIELKEILKMQNLVIEYDFKKNKINAIVNIFGYRHDEKYWFLNNDIDILYTEVIYGKESSIKKIYEYLNTLYEHILVWKTFNLWTDCLPDNFSWQLSYNDTFGHKEQFLFNYSFISNVDKYYLLNQYLKKINYNLYTENDLQRITFKKVDKKELKKYILLDDNYTRKLPFNNGDCTILKYLYIGDVSSYYPYDSENAKEISFIIGEIDGHIVSIIGLSLLYNKTFVSYISIRNDLKNKGIATKMIEYFSTINNIKIYGTSPSEEGSKCKINDIFKRYLGDKFTPATHEFF